MEGGEGSGGRRRRWREEKEVEGGWRKGEGRRRKDVGTGPIRQWHIQATYFSKSGAKSAAFDSLVKPVTYNVFLGIVVERFFPAKIVWGTRGTGDNVPDLGLVATPAARLRRTDKWRHWLSGDPVQQW